MRGPKATPRPCESCGSEHIGQIPCGMTWLERMKTTRLDHSWMPNPPNRRNYYDDEPLKEVFGADSKERHEQMMDETAGFGPVTRESSDEHFKAVIGDPDAD